jgi:hypothetical protein
VRMVELWANSILENESIKTKHIGQKKSVFGLN